MNKINAHLSNFFKNYALKRISKRYNTGESWVIVTGCTSGIGKSYAENLSKSNFNLILISRNNEKLNSLENELKTINESVKILKIPLDFSIDDSFNTSKEKELLDLFSNKKIKILINNVGLSNFIGNFAFSKHTNNMSMINVNIKSHVFLSHLFIQSQLKYCAQNPSTKSENFCLINVCSIFGEITAPGLALYSSSKHFLKKFSKCLFYEYKNKNLLNLDILCLNPYYVKTKMISFYKNYFIIEPEKVVLSSFLKINSYTINSYGNWKHFIICLYVKMIPSFIYSRYTYNYFQEQFNKLVSIRSKLKK